ncbi:MAG: M48 family metallopeptidase [Nevskia sp.]|jgi:Zn-dependent protease with chaperone function|nr:M48 family metallopeptidase [Nevskia sp.]MCK9383608.1 M48 family metallopeptidase [Nevskia sp.]
MTEEKFIALVERLSLRAKAHPGLYRLEVLALAALGYLYIFMMLIAALAVSAVFIVISLLKPILLLKLAKIVWLPIWFSWSVLRALWVRFDPPKGRLLQPREAPQLFAEIERVRAEIRGPKPHKVLITDDYNAAVMQRPRLGPLGWSENYLILGLPLMSTLSPDQLRAVIAHEFGHLGAGDSRMTGRIYHMRQTWARLQQEFAQRGGVFFRRFFAWFGPYFNAYSFVLARSQEYAADQASTRLAGAGPVGEALVLANIGNDYQNETIWRPLWARIKHEEQPGVQPYAQLLQLGRAISEWGDADGRLEKALQRKTDWADTHPALKDRLTALGQTARVPAVQGPSAAVVFLGPLAEILARELDETWQRDVGVQWRERHQQLQVQQETLRALEAKAAEAPLTRAEDWQRAELTEALQDAETALPLYEAHRAQFPEAFEATYAVGRILLQRGDEAGLPFIDAAMRVDGAAIKPGAELAFRYLTERNRDDEAQPYRAAWTARNDLELLAQAERAHFTASDNYLEHQLDAEALARMQERARGLKGVARIWLVRKKVQHFPEHPAYLMLIKGHWYQWTNAKRLIAEARTKLELADTLTIAVYQSGLKSLFKRATKVRGAEIYRA